MSRPCADTMPAVTVPPRPNVLLKELFKRGTLRGLWIVFLIRTQIRCVWNFIYLDPHGDDRGLYLGHQIGKACRLLLALRIRSARAREPRPRQLRIAHWVSKR